MSIEQISIAAGVILSLCFSYIPGLKDKFALLSVEKKQLVMLAAIFVVVAGAYLLSLAGVLFLFTPDKAGLFAAFQAFFLALIANAGFYAGTNRVAKG